jgi:3-hydroxyacyl-CoA dehydrogenase
MPHSDAVAIIGAGDMGHGFAAHFAAHGHDVTLIDHRQVNIDDARERIRDVVSFLNGEGVTAATPDEVLEAIAFTLDRAGGVADADLVLESISEDLETKREMFAALADEAPDEAVLATNTSGIPITDIAEAVPEAADRVAGCHWWYPPYLLPTVEVVRGEETADATMDYLEAFLESVDRIPVRVERDVPGFVWNRIQMAIFRESLHLAEEGVASLEDINRAIRDGYALRTAAIGPIETIDIAGLDLVRTVIGDLSPHLCDDDEPNPLFEQYLSEGRGGIEDGAGFFEYDESPEAITGRRDERVMAIRRALDREAGVDAGDGDA